jgi:hypothetical protein
VTLPVLTHTPVDGGDFMPSGWCGACEHCGPAPVICLACSYTPDGGPNTPVLWPCPHADAEGQP